MNFTKVFEEKIPQKESSHYFRIIKISQVLLLLDS